MLLLKRNATVTICHTKTKNIKDIAKNADILIAAAESEYDYKRLHFYRNHCY